MDCRKDDNWGKMGEELFLKDFKMFCSFCFGVIIQNFIVKQLYFFVDTTTLNYKRSVNGFFTLRKYYHILAYTDKHHPRYCVGVVSIVVYMLFLESGSFSEHRQ